jgi:saccharopepsin
MSAAGTWKNEYGSIMTLVEKGNNLSGVYQSSTGSVGTYAVLGVQVGNAATTSLGQPLALAISWLAIDDALPDPSWHWSSGLCGQINYENGEEVMVLAHTLVASSDFPSVAGVGSYIDKLTYKRVAAQLFDPFLYRKHEAPGNPLAGRWLAANGSHLTLRVDAAYDRKLGVVSGSIVQQTGTLNVKGFTDLHMAAGDLSLQSVALTANVGESQVLALSGTLDIGAGRLTLLDMTSAATAPDTRYCQTRIASTLYNRHDAC